VPCTQSGDAAFPPNKDLNMDNIVLGSALIPVLVVSCTHVQSEHALHMHRSFAQFPEPSGSDMLSQYFTSRKKARLPCSRTTRNEGSSARDTWTSRRAGAPHGHNSTNCGNFKIAYMHACIHLKRPPHMHTHPRALAKR